MRSATEKVTSATTSALRSRWRPAPTPAPGCVLERFGEFGFHVWTRARTPEISPVRQRRTPSANSQNPSVNPSSRRVVAAHRARK